MTVVISGKDNGAIATRCKQNFPVTAFVSALSKDVVCRADCLADDHSSRGRRTKKSHQPSSGGFISSVSTAEENSCDQTGGQGMRSVHRQLYMALGNKGQAAGLQPKGWRYLWLLAGL